MLKNFSMHCHRKVVRILVLLFCYSVCSYSCEKVYHTQQSLQEKQGKKKNLHSKLVKKISLYELRDSGVFSNAISADATPGTYGACVLAKASSPGRKWVSPAQWPWGPDPVAQLHFVQVINYLEKYIFK